MIEIPLPLKKRKRKKEEIPKKQRKNNSAILGLLMMCRLGKM